MITGLKKTQTKNTTMITESPGMTSRSQADKGYVKSISLKDDNQTGDQPVRDSQAMRVHGW